MKKQVLKSLCVWAAALTMVAGLAACGASDAEESSTEEPSAEITESTDEEADPGELDGYRLQTGELLDVNPAGGSDGTTLVIKAKIQGLSSNQRTIDQNYYNVADIIQNQGGTDFEAIDYWAVMDTRDGEEVKVVAFVVDADTIHKIADGTVLPDQMGDYVTDLYIHPSLSN